MKLFNAAQLKSWDAQTLQEEKIEIQDLINRAAQACLGPILTILSQHTFTKLYVFCGPGNNGRDGLAVAKLLAERNYQIDIYCAEELKEECICIADSNQHMLAQLLMPDSDLPFIEPGSLVIDALFGSGFNQPIRGQYEKLISLINQAKAFVVAIDLPSGIGVEPNSTLFQEHLIAIKASITISFQQPKPVFFFEELAKYIGNWQVIEIGLSRIFENQTNSLIHYQNELPPSKWTRNQIKFGYKGLYGHLALFAGSVGMAGAAVLAGKAAMRTGVGLLSFYVPEPIQEIVQISLPEAMVNLLQTNTHPEGLSLKNKYQAIAIGPGMGKNVYSHELLQTLTELNHDTPFVIDADAIHLCAQLLNAKPHWKFPKHSILTPHPKELKSLVGDAPNSFELLKKAQHFAIDKNVVVVLKGAFTRIISPDGTLVFNGTGNELLSTAGAGDVLTGIIGSLLAQGMNVFEAATYGVCLHGTCADALKLKGRHTALASDIIEEIPFLV